MFATLFSWAGSFLGGPLTAITGQIAGYFTSAKNVEATEFSAMTSAQQAEYLGLLQAQTQLNQAKLQNNWWGAHLMVYLFGLPAALHWSAVFIASTFTQLHWSVPAAPAVYQDAELKIALSFFILAPTLALGGPIFASLASRIRG